jgi:hypothetical protein
MKLQEQLEKVQKDLEKVEERRKELQKKEKELRTKIELETAKEEAKTFHLFRHAVSFLSFPRKKHTFVQHICMLLYCKLPEIYGFSTQFSQRKIGKIRIMFNKHPAILLGERP